MIPLPPVMTPAQQDGLAAFLEGYRALGGHDREMTARAEEARAWCAGRADTIG